MAATYTDTDEFRDASFTMVVFSGAKFRDCDLRNVKIVDCELANLSLSGAIANLRVKDVDVTSFVEAELDRRYPERIQLRAMTSADEYRAMWDTIEHAWSETVERARRLPEAALHQRVDDEWSFVETLRHLIFATDAWAGHAVLEEPTPFARIALPHTPYPREDIIALGIDPDADPPLGEVLDVRATRMALVRSILDRLTDADLQRPWARSPGPGYSQEPRPIGRCLRVVMNEECEHRRYATRDLALLEPMR
jgi:uncharacterized protein YjbI with pentapeptide repeats